METLTAPVHLTAMMGQEMALMTVLTVQMATLMITTRLMVIVDLAARSTQMAVPMTVQLLKMHQTVLIHQETVPNMPKSRLRHLTIHQ